MFRIAPSLLAADWLHVDVMNNHHVPHLTFGQMVCQALRKHGTVPIDVHLTVPSVDALAIAGAAAGADLAGSAIFGQPDDKAVITVMRVALAQ